MAVVETIETPSPAAKPSLRGEAGVSAEMALFGIYEISKLLAIPARLEHTLAGVLSLLSGFLDMRNGLIALLNGEGAAEIAVGSGWSEGNAERYFRRLPERAIGQIIVTKMPLVVENVAQDALFSDFDFSEWGAGGASYSFIGVPIKDRDKVIGTLTIDRNWSGTPRFHFDEDVRFLTMVANLIGQTVRLHRLLGRDRDHLLQERSRLEKELEAKAMPPAAGLTPPAAGIAGIVGDSPSIRAVLEKVRIVARSHSTVLLRGESGTGKELFAHALHTLSPRRDRPFIKLNCAALPESVLESELFGHEKGAFTGAIAQRKGRFELADGGTLFLDEIGEISPAFQAKLLRVLQEGEFERVGGNRTLKVDVRLICATNRDLETAVAKGEFRSDLYYRISVVPIALPALRDRPGDISLLAQEFIKRFNAEHGLKLELSDSALVVLSACYFPGNIRELENCIRRTATLARGTKIVDTDFACRNDGCLSAVLWKNSGQRTAPAPVLPLHPIAAAPAGKSPADEAVHGDETAGALPIHHCPAPSHCPLPRDADAERERLVKAMETAGWVQAKAARLLGMSPRQIGYALRKHNVPIKHF